MSEGESGGVAISIPVDQNDGDSHAVSYDKMLKDSSLDSKEQQKGKGC
jgi:hypothetical protein